MVASPAAGRIRHMRFGDVANALRPGDVLVVNVSATVPAAVDGVAVGRQAVRDRSLRASGGEVGARAGAQVGAAEGTPVRLHFSQSVAGDLWTVEPRRPLGIGSAPWRDFPGGLVALGPGTDRSGTDRSGTDRSATDRSTIDPSATDPSATDRSATVNLLAPDSRSPRLWLTQTAAMGDVLEFLARHGRPVRYAHETVARPLEEHQTVFASEPGSAEMPSAGRPFTTELVAKLVAMGVVFAPLVLHCGVASFEEGEVPDAERYRVPELTAALVNLAHAHGDRVIAVGTTSARALESVTDTRGVVHPGAGVTDLVITPKRGVRAIDGIVSGWHDAGASHLELLEAVAGTQLLERCYGEAHRHDYLWHEFGDALLLFGPHPNR